MTREETKKFLFVITSLYPNFKLENITAAIEAWHFALEEYEFQDAKEALNSYLKNSRSGFAPSASQIINLIYEKYEEPELTNGEVINLICKAISNSSYNSISEFNMLPEALREAVGSPDNLRQWGMTENLNLEVVYSQIIKAYKERAKYKKAAARTSGLPLLKQKAQEQLEGGTL